MKHPLKLLALAMFAGLSVPAQAAVSADEARQLGTTLTPWGAEQAGNKEGTIPAYGKDTIAVPASFDPKKPGVLPDPYANEKPLYSITEANVDKYADKLTEGTKTALTRFHTMRVDVYPTHRTAVYPTYVMDNALKNATACKLVSNGMKLEGCFGGTPFPIPKTGLEVVWNKLARYEFYSWAANFTSWFVDTGGRPILQGEQYGAFESPLYDPLRFGPAAADEIFWRTRIDVNAPARRSGEKLLVVDSVDYVSGRRAWQYLPGQRRVKLSPDLAYDTPNPQSGYASTMDEALAFLGAPDRFEWKLLGKKEMLIPYNAFKFADSKACPNKMKMTIHHPNPDCVRWELHRVWAVEGTLKPGMRHLYAKRMLYLDEDVPGAAIGEGYDSSGRVYRSTYTLYYPYYPAQGLVGDTSVTLDFSTGTWCSVGEVAETGGWYPILPKGNRYYTPDALAADGVR